MSTAMMILAALFLPLFPLSMVFNQAFMRLRHPWQRALLLLVWPQLGVFLLLQASAPVPDWLIGWALFSALFYAYRAIALRDAGRWIGFVATSAWALLWLSGEAGDTKYLEALGFSAPLVLATLLAGEVERRFGAAHTRMKLGLAAIAPRLAGLFVMAVLAVVATPIFPNFFTMLSSVALHASATPVIAVILMCVWLLWTWSGAQLLQGIVVGEGKQEPVEDISVPITWAFAIGFIVLAIAGVQLAGVLL